MKKQFIAVFTLLIIFCTSCIKDVNVDLPNEADKIVVNCLFTPDSLWNVYVGLSTNLEANYTHRTIADAVVEIYENDVFSTTLTYTDGRYKSADKKPQAGSVYKIIVSVSGFDPVWAIDSVPREKASIVSHQFDTIPFALKIQKLFEEEPVNRISTSIKLTSNKQSYYQFRFYTIDIDEKTIYKISQNSFDRMTADSINIEITNVLINIVGNSYYGKKALDSDIYRYYDFTKPIFYTDILNSAIKYSEKTISTINSPNLYTQRKIFVMDNLFESINNDSYDIFNIENTSIPTQYDFDLYVDNWIFTNGLGHSNHETNKTDWEILNIELWLDLRTISHSMYQYQTTYIKQVTGLFNPFTESVSVFNNIQGGLGIFAGYLTDHVQINIPKHNIVVLDLY